MRARQQADGFRAVVDRQTQDADTDPADSERHAPGKARDLALRLLVSPRLARRLAVQRNAY
jgi:hypothetical protein